MFSGDFSLHSCHSNASTRIFCIIYVYFLKQCRRYMGILHGHYIMAGLVEHSLLLPVEDLALLLCFARLTPLLSSARRNSKV